MSISSLNTFLLELYKLTGRGPSPEFSRQAFELLQSAVPFDSGLWGTFSGTGEGPRAHWGYLHSLAPAMLEEYERVKRYDLVSQRSVAQVGTTLNVSLEEAGSAVHPDMLRHARKWGMLHTLATTVLESPINLYTVVCLYRNDSSQPFTESERSFVEAIVPHLVQAWHLNGIHFLDASEPAAAGSRARAVIDRYGVLYQVEPQFSSLVRRATADWQGPRLPASLIPAFEAGGRERRSGDLVISVVRNLPDQLFLVSLRSRAPIDTLSPRELMVAREFASGKTHKEIAQLFGTSPTTVRTQIRDIYAKLRVRTKVALVREVQRSS
jgi:DNA-binding CsgD family transcriptional regulator